ncbi:unnamed protein product [Closterium sp. NIES-54]
MALLGTPPQFLPPSLTRLPDRLMPVRNALLAMHPMCLITELIKFHLTKVETRFRTIASTTGVVVLPIFEGCSPPQFPTPTASAAVTQPTARAEIAAVFALYGGWGKHMGGRDRGKGGVLASSCAVVTMVGAVVDTGVVDTLEARLENARRCHKANEYGDLPCAVIEAGICAVWATEHSSRPVSPRPVNTEGGVDAGVNAGGGQVGSSAGGTLRQRGVIHADEVGGVQARGVGRRRLQAPRKATSEVDEADCRRCRRPT